MSKYIKIALSNTTYIFILEINLDPVFFEKGFDNILMFLSNLHSVKIFISQQIAKLDFHWRSAPLPPTAYE